MPKVNPFVGLFVAVVAVLAAFAAPVVTLLIAQGERLARVEGTVAGALGRGFPERMAQAPEAEAGADG